MYSVLHCIQKFVDIFYLNGSTYSEGGKNCTRILVGLTSGGSDTG